MEDVIAQMQYTIDFDSNTGIEATDYTAGDSQAANDGDITIF
jgi:hypothetical protein